MNKKYLSALLFGAMTLASTGTFTSCKDYDDDIENLQGQIDKNAEAAKADLQAQADALKGQIASLEAVQTQMGKDLQAAKETAAKAAQKAQSTADQGLEIAQKATKDLEAALKRVATLEGKVAVLEDAIKALKAKDAEFDAELVAIKAAIEANGGRIDVVAADLLALSTKMDNTFAEVKASIQVVNEALATFSKATTEALAKINATLAEYAEKFATKTELSDLAEEVATQKTQLLDKIAANKSLIDNLTAALGETNADLAALKETVEAQKAELLAEIAKLQQKDAELEKALEAQVAALKEEIKQAEGRQKAALEAAQKTLQDQIDALKAKDSEIEKNLKDAVERLDKKDADLDAADKKLREDLEAYKKALEAADAKLQKQILDNFASLTKSIKDVQDALTAQISTVADNLEKTYNYLNTRIDEARQYAKTLVDELGVKVEELAAKFNNYYTKGEVDAQVEAITTAYLKAVKGVQDDLDGFKQTANAELAALKTATTENKEAIKTLNDKVNAIFDVISKRLTSLSVIPTEHIHGIAAVRVKTLNYVPQKYFVNDHASSVIGSNNNVNHGYSPLPWLDHKDIVGANEVFVSTEKNKVYFHVSPSFGVKEETIGKISFNTIQSTNTRAAEVAKTNDGVEPVKFSINGDEMEVVYKKNTPNFIGTTSSGIKEQFKMISLKAPIAEELWSDAEKAQKKADKDFEVAVNSEYVRLEEDVLHPFIANRNTNWNDVTTGFFADDKQHNPVTGEDFFVHYHDSACVYHSKVGQLIDYKFLYNDEVDLKELVTVCASDMNSLTHKHEHLADYADYGLQFRFYMAEGEYMTLGGAQGNSNLTDQQKFANIADPVKGIMKSQVYSIGDPSITAVGREPIVRVELRDIASGRNNLVAQRYIKIKWVKTVNKTAIVIPQKVANFDCAGYQGLINTQQMNELIYHKLGMSKAQFHASYKFDPNIVSGVGTVTELVNNQNSVESYNYKWSLSPIQVGAIWQNDNKEYTVSFRFFNPAGILDDVIVTMSVKIEMPTIGLYGHNRVYWKNDQYFTFNVNPIVFDNAEAAETSNIWTNLLNGFVDKNQQFPGREDIDKILYKEFGGVRSDYNFNYAGLRFEFDSEKLGTGSYVYYDENGNKLSWRLSPDHTILYLGDGDVEAARIFNDDLTSLIRDSKFNIRLAEVDDQYNQAYNPSKLDDWNGTKAAQALIGKEVPIKLVADLCGDNVNVKTIKAYEAHIIEPLKMTPSVEGKWIDAEIGGSAVDIDKVAIYKDWNNYLVARSEISNPGIEGRTGKMIALYKYYKVRDLSWPVDGSGKIIATSNLQNDGHGNLIPGNTTKGKLPANVEIKLENRGGKDVLVYYNYSGTPVNEVYKVYIDVTTGYKWQTIHKLLEIEVHPAAGTNPQP